MAITPNTIGASFVGPIVWVTTFISIGLLFGPQSHASSTTRPEDISVNLTTIMAIAGTAAGTIVTAYIALLRYAVGQEKKRIDEQLKLVSDAVKDMHQDNKRATSDDMTAKIEFVRMQSSLNSIGQLLAELKASQLQRVEWETWAVANEKRLTHLEEQVREFKGHLSRLSGQYSTTMIQKTKTKDE